MMEFALAQTDGSAEKAWKLLNIARSTFYRMVKKLGLAPDHRLKTVHDVFASYFAYQVEYVARETGEDPLVILRELRLDELSESVRMLLQSRAQS